MEERKINDDKMSAEIKSQNANLETSKNQAVPSRKKKSRKLELETAKHAKPTKTGGERNQARSLKNRNSKSKNQATLKRKKTEMKQDTP